MASQLSSSLTPPEDPYLEWLKFCYVRGSLSPDWDTGGEDKAKHIPALKSIVASVPTRWNIFVLTDADVRIGKRGKGGN